MHPLDQRELALLRTEISQAPRKPAELPSLERREQSRESNGADEGKGSRFLIALLRALSVMHV